MTDYRVISKWKPLYLDDKGIIESDFIDLKEARRYGLTMSCCDGAEAIVVQELDGQDWEPHCVWTRLDSHWHDLTNAARAARPYI